MVAADKNYLKCIVPIAMLYLTAYLASFPVAYKLVQIGPIIETGAIFLFPFCYSLGDVIAEVYGYSISRQMVWMSIVCGLMFCVLVIAVVHMPSPFFWRQQKEFADVLYPMYKIFFAMTAGSLFGSFVNLYLITKWKILINGKCFWLRSIGASSAGELVFSIIAGLITFAQVEPAEKVFFLIINGWIFKVIYSIAMSGPASVLVYILKKIEKISVVNQEVEFNPFKVGLEKSDSAP